MGDVGCSVAAGSDLNGVAFEARGRCARHAMMFEDEFAQAAFGIGGGLAAFFFVGDVYEEFDDAPVLSIGDGVGEGVDDDLPIAEQGFVVDGVVEVTGEAGVVPEQNACGAVFWAAGGIYEAIEVFAGGGGCARSGDVYEFVAECEPVGLAVGGDFGDLLVGGGVLTRSARVADVDVYDGAWGECGWGREVFQFEAGDSGND